MSDDVLVVLALKSLDRAKSRLAARLPIGLDREELVAAMFADTVEAAQAAGLRRIAVVSPDPRVLALAERLTAAAIAEPPSTTGLNAALVHAAGHAPGAAAASRIVYLQADLPALHADSLRAALTEAAPHTAAFVADRSGEGTAMLTVRRDSGALLPAFGPASANAHRRAGAVELDPGRDRWADLRCDVDTPDDLRAAQRLGLGPRSGAALARRAVGYAAHDQR